jgi:hypothetical protein
MAEQQQFTQQKQNPLANYFRQPKIYVRLPSGGEFYPPGSLDASQNGEYAVYAMTAKDELIFKTPDALMNGQATVEVIKSCVPAVRDPWKMPSIDIDAVLVAIRIATYGESMEVAAMCPACNEKNEYEFSLLNYLEFLAGFKFEAQVNSGPLTINIRPYNYQEVTKTAIKALEQQKIFEIVNSEELSDEEKLDKFGASFLRLTELTVDTIVGCIASIDTPEGRVSDPAMLREFVNNAPREVFNAVNEHVSEMKNRIDLKAQDVKCDSCQHEYSINITMDQSNFFAVRS